MYTVIHSEDPYLLARMATDLEMGGVGSDREWNDKFYHFSNNLSIHISHPEEKIKNRFTFLYVSSYNPDVRIELTESNYTETLLNVLTEYHSKK